MPWQPTPPQALLQTSIGPGQRLTNGWKLKRNYRSAAIILSLGPLTSASVDRMAGISGGIESLKPIQLVDHITTLYGTPTEADVALLEDIQASLQNFTNFRDPVNAIVMNIHTLDYFGQCQPEGTKIKWLELTLQAHPQLTSSIFLWKTANTNIKTRQLSSLIAYLFKQYGSLKPEPNPRGVRVLSGQRQKNHRKWDRGLNRDQSHRPEENRERGLSPRRQKRRRSRTLIPPGGGRTAASAEITSRDSVSQVGSTTGTAFSTRSTSLYDNPRAVSRSTGYSRSTSAGSRARSSAAAAPIILSEAEITPHHKYCYIHGHNRTHWGTACRDMAVAPDIYQNAIGAKKHSHTDPSGETHVQPLKGAAKSIQISGSFSSWPERPEQH
jgi:hypothetical protein